jgi:alpha,alpha-trehalase
VLREYSFLADGERGVLVGPTGDFVWMCAPRWDSEAVFSSLVGGGGVYAVTPSDDRFVWGGYYEDNSLIWRSCWVTTIGVIECREALAFPGDPHTGVVLRRIMAVRGPARVRVLLDARAGFAVHKMGHLMADQGVWTARSGGPHLRWAGGAGAQLGPGGRLELQIHPLTYYFLASRVHGRALMVSRHRAWATRSKWRGAMNALLYGRSLVLTAGGIGAIGNASLRASLRASSRSSPDTSSRSRRAGSGRTSVTR